MTEFDPCQATGFLLGNSSLYVAVHHGLVERLNFGVKFRLDGDHVLPGLRRMEKRSAFGVYFIFKSMEQGRTFRITVPKYPTQDPNHRILAHQRSRFCPGRGRDIGCPIPPAQIPTGGITAWGSYLG